MINKNAVIIGLGAALLIISTAAGTTLFINSKDQAPPSPQKVVIRNHMDGSRQTVSATRCRDGNVAGKVIGGIGGGVVGSLMGGGVGKTATTIGGTLAGAYVGGKAIPTDDATCPH